MSLEQLDLNLIIKVPSTAKAMKYYGPLLSTRDGEKLIVKKVNFVSRKDSPLEVQLRTLQQSAFEVIIEDCLALLLFDNSNHV